MPPNSRPWREQLAVLMRTMAREPRWVGLFRWQRPGTMQNTLMPRYRRRLAAAAPLRRFARNRRFPNGTWAAAHPRNAARLPRRNAAPPRSHARVAPPPVGRIAGAEQLRKSWGARCRVVL